MLIWPLDYQHIQDHDKQIGCVWTHYLPGVPAALFFYQTYNHFAIPLCAEHFFSQTMSVLP